MSVEFPITFSFASQEHLDNATAALAAHYGIGADSKEKPAEFVKRMLLAELQQRVVVQLARLAAQRAYEAAQKPAQDAATLVTVE